MPSQAVPSLWGIPSLQRYMRHPRGLARRPPSRRLNSGPFSHCYGRAESQGMRSHGYSTNGGRVRFFRDIASVTMDLNGVERIDFHALGGADNIVINDLSGTDLPAGGLLRNSGTGGSEVYDISNNLITNAAFLGTVGLDWQVMGFGNFSSRGETDMILRNANNGGVEVYDISNNQITGASFLGTVGLNWQFSGVGNFSGLGESDMLLRNANSGGLEVYDIANNQDRQKIAAIPAIPAIDQRPQVAAEILALGPSCVSPPLQLKREWSPWPEFGSDPGNPRELSKG